MAEELVDLVVDEVSGVDHPANLMEGWIVMKAVTRQEADGPHPASDYAYVPDPQKPSEWKLRIDDKVHVGAAAASFGAGAPHGQPVSVPAADAAGVKAKIRAAWLKFNPDKTEADLPPDVRKAAGEEDDLEVEFAALIEEAVAFAKGTQDLMAAMEAAKPWLMDAPPDVKAAANLLYDYCANGATAGDGQAPAAGPAQPAPAAPQPGAGMGMANKGLIRRALERVLGRLTKAETNDNEEDELVKPEDIEAVAKAVAEATVKAISENAAAAEAEGATEEAAAEEAAGETPAAEAESFIKAEDLEAVKTELGAEKASHEATREALSQALDRVAAIEKRFSKSSQPKGQETEAAREGEEDPKPDAKASMLKAIRAA
jgi:hypothetical protein